MTLVVMTSKVPMMAIPSVITAAVDKASRLIISRMDSINSYIFLIYHRLKEVLCSKRDISSFELPVDCVLTNY